VAVGIIDVKSYYIETPEDIAKCVRQCLQFAPAERLSFAPDCGLSQTARWASRLKLQNMVKGVQIVKKELTVTGWLWRIKLFKKIFDEPRKSWINSTLVARSKRILDPMAGASSPA
jgi:hypothetical protein